MRLETSIVNEKDTLAIFRCFSSSYEDSLVIFVGKAVRRVAYRTVRGGGRGNATCEVQGCAVPDPHVITGPRSGQSSSRSVALNCTLSDCTLGRGLESQTSLPLH